MNFFKKFLLYFFIIVGAVVAIVGIVLAVMYFAPGTQVLGYEFLNYNQTKLVEFTAETNIKPTDFEAIEVNSKATQVYFLPSDKADVVYYTHREGMSGFVRVATSSLYVSAEVVEKSYSEEADGQTYRTLVLNVVEPEGVLMSQNNPILTVYLPSTLNVLSANTEKGNIAFTTLNKTKETEFTTLATKFYANSKNGGDIFIKNPTGTNNYYLYSTTGNVSFENPVTVDASVKFTTDTGKLTFSNPDPSSNSKLTGDLEVYSYIDNKGPTIDFSGAVLGNVKVVADYVNLKISGGIGQKEAQTSFAITTDKSEINILSTVYARMTLASKSTQNANNVTIDGLYYDATEDEHILDVGLGSVTLGTTIGAVGIDATTGNVKVSNAYDDVKIVTTMGDIFVAYNPDAEFDGAPRAVSGDLTIDTDEGNVEVKNLRGSLNVKVNSLKSEPKMDVHFLDIRKDSLISAKTRRVNITTTASEKIEAGYICRLLLTIGNADFGLSSGQRSEITSGDYDFIDGENYNAQYRLGYAKSQDDEVYTGGLFNGSYGKIVVNTSGKVYVSAG